MNCQAWHYKLMWELVSGGKSEGGILQLEQDDCVVLLRHGRKKMEVCYVIHHLGKLKRKIWFAFTTRFKFLITYKITLLIIHLVIQRPTNF